MSIDTLTVGLIGAGRIGLLHAQHLARHIPMASLLMVADVNEKAARECAQRFAIPYTTQNYQAILENPDIQAVVICSPTDTHARVIQEAAQAGKHIFCEKPIALDLPSIDQAVAVVASAGVKLQIGFNRRFDANYRRVRQALERLEIGRPQILNITSRDPGPPPLAYIRVSGGLFLDMMIHDFDMARFLIDSEVEEVFTMAGVMHDPALGEVGDVDTAVVMLRFANGAIATINNSRYASYGYDQRVELLGSSGAISIDNKYANTAIISDGQSIRRDLPLHFFLERYNESFLLEMTAFVDSVLHDRPVPVNEQDGRAPVVLALAARRSLDEQRPISIDEMR